jgi:hypothetical protein
MNDIARIVLAAVLLAVSAGAGAQLYKCEGADGKTSYADRPCGPGKKDAGPIEDQINVAPAPKAKAPRQAVKPKSTPHGASTAKPTPPVAAGPERRCFNVKSNRMGSAIRCNDDPGVPDPTPTDERSKAERKAE